MYRDDIRVTASRRLEYEGRLHEVLLPLGVNADSMVQIVRVDQLQNADRNVVSIRMDVAYTLVRMRLQ